ncbi:C40 family peptidase [Paenibacillus cremeus]|uniref:NlpC/P60 family protein n=1 Tax=Paenibacillus cremeus TaxID=2163881 RepID=A0A559KA69_9BACL|nr:C40 family peptidase [Paenibacillus cremeus]TVY09012.1 NlpC/P60 family protein [Paenibacillus cremeus]
MKKTLKASLIAATMMVTSAGVMGAFPHPTEAAASTSTATKIVSTAKTYIGKVKYKYSTRDPQHLTFDCSSFTEFVFAKQGIDLPWGSKAQAKVGTFVSKANLKPGDLVFFSVGTPGRIDHVGVYVGNNQFISNTKSSGVVINPMNSGYWKNRYITGRRV